MLLITPPSKILDRKVETDFRKWLKFGAMWDSPLAPNEKYALSLLNILGEVPEEHERYFDAIWMFYNCGEIPIGEAPKERVLDWTKDSMTIWADFRVFTGINLDHEKMHWWEFMALFHSLPPDAQIKRRISIRSMDLSKVGDPQTRAEYLEQKRLVALSDLPDDIDDIYERMVENEGT